MDETLVAARCSDMIEGFERKTEVLSMCRPLRETSCFLVTVLCCKTPHVVFRFLRCNDTVARGFSGEGSLRFLIACLSNLIASTKFAPSLHECIFACFRIFDLYHTSFVMHSSGAMILLSNFSDIDFTDNSLQAFKRVTACMLREKGFVYASFVLGEACRFHNFLTFSIILG